ncbi:MAG: DNA gyrase subunit A [Acidobacteria bacterium]|jgi:DNA gyrase subunit A|nr:MAG: DNA gyrase subunit A [Acidobacteriota bacterium]GIU82318.1 MAG: hypothetical protein KatS3mg006_1382 [Pyrinomonadaceae bacterium]
MQTKDFITSQVSIEDEMRRSYLDYAMSVIIGRALPDVRDGLKPVHRRVLWAMHELGNTHNKPYKKSARIVGECFVAGSLVHTAKGLKPIEKIEIGESVLMPNGKTSRVIQTYHNPPSEIVEVFLSNGCSLKVTKKQKFRVLTNDLEIVWEYAENLAGKKVLVSSPEKFNLPETHNSQEKINSACKAGFLLAKEFSNEIPFWILEDRRLFAPFLAGLVQGVFSLSVNDFDYNALKSSKISGIQRVKGVQAIGIADFGISTHEVVLSAASKSLVLQIQAMLADVGLHGTANESKEIVDSIENSCLEKFALKLRGKTALRFFDWIRPYLKTELKATYEILNRTFLTQENLRAESSSILANLNDTDSLIVEKLEDIVKNYSIVECVTVVDKGERAETFDVEIEDEGHEFLVQGCAVHNCLGKYHPHGDMAVYETIVRMAQSFSMRYPLIDGQGNFGSIDGDLAAAQRYTEVRMARIAEELLADIEKETVDFQPNYDDSLSEPVVLPARFPNLLVNGSEGIAVGMATKIPPHNLSEIIDATIELIKNPDITIDELIKYVPGPDFPTGGFIYGREGIYRAYKEGRGVIQIRAKAAIDRIEHGSSSRDAIVITEIPYQVNKAKLIEKIAELIQERKLEDIAEIRDESNREGIRVVLELKRGATAQVILNKLYKLTPMQSSFGIINLALVNGQPKILNLKQLLEAFVNFRREVVRRRTEYELKKAKARAHVLEGLNKAIDALDYIIPLIRNSRSIEEAKAWLTGDFSTLYEVKNWRGIPSDKTVSGFLKDLEKAIARLNFSEIQAQAILDLQLRRLSALERQKIIDELEQLLKQISELEAILASEKLLRQVIIKELQEIKKQFGDPRRTEIVDAGVEIKIEDLIADEDVVITVTKMGYIKRTPVTSYSRQRRGGKGKLGAKAKDEDFVEHLFIASTHAYLMIFTNDGQVYKLKVHEIPEAEPSARGKAIVNLLPIPSDKKIVAVLPIRDFNLDAYVTMVTKEGTIKKTPLSEYQNIRSSGINAIKVSEGDELITAMLTDGKKQIFIATGRGMAVRFDESDVRPMGRVAMGVRGISLRDGDFVVSACAVSPEGSEKILSISEKGYGKQTQVSSYRLTKRGAYGVINMKVTEKTGNVVAAFPVDENSEVMIITRQGKLIRIGVDKIRETGRSAQGVILINTNSDDFVTSASILREEDEEESETTKADAIEFEE